MVLWLYQLEWSLELVLGAKCKSRRVPDVFFTLQDDWELGWILVIN